jgi:predicted ferric reductase
MKKSIALIIVYIILISFPLILAVIVNPGYGGSFVYELGKNFALVGLAIISFQILLAGRFKWLASPFGFDILIRFHKYVALLGITMLILHPIFLVIGGAGLDLVLSIDSPWYLWLGRIAIGLLLINAILTRFQTAWRIKFERWRVMHDMLAPVIIILGFVHSWNIGSDLWNTPMRVLWVFLPVVSVLLFLYHRFMRPLILSRHAYGVVEVKEEAEKVWTVRMTPPQGREVYDYLPGQFQFITFKRRKGLPVEEHHWTISSSPHEKGYINSTIKALGDFTATMGETKAGDTAVIHAPFGRFSYVLHPDEKSLVFISGGIGITPIMGMLRHMRDTKSTMPVVLLYGNRREKDIVFKTELEEIENDGHPALKVLHVLSKPDGNWNGETGYIDRVRIEKYCANLKDKGFYVCGPPGLVEKTVKNLRDLKVPNDQIHIELFSFLD